MLLEEWRLCLSWPHYEVSSLGNVRRKIASAVSPAGYIMTASPRPNGYLSVTLCRAGVYKRVNIHRLVCETFHGKPPYGMTDAAHIDGDKKNNSAANIKWMTSKENQNDKRVHGTIAIGERIAQSKLTAPEVIAIRNAYIGGRSQRAIAKQFGITQTNVGCIVRRETWRHI